MDDVFSRTLSLQRLESLIHPPYLRHIVQHLGLECHQTFVEARACLIHAALAKGVIGIHCLINSCDGRVDMCQFITLS